MQVYNVIKAINLYHNAEVVMLRNEDKSTTNFGQVLITQLNKISSLLKLKKIKLDNVKMIAIDEADFFFERPEDRAQVKDFYERHIKEDV